MTNKCSYNPLTENKIKHSASVAEFCLKNSVYFDIEPDIAYFIGLNHDIGYLYCKEGHSKKGYQLLCKVGVKKQLANVVFHHGSNPKDVYVISKELILLWCADLSIDKEGNYIGFRKRLTDIKTRYGSESSQYLNAKDTVSFCKAYLKDNHIRLRH